MIPNNKHRHLESGGTADTTSFGISMKDAPHILGILRDQIYSDKVLAVLREYSSNAWDAHRQVGKHDVPIVVRLPTQLNPVLTIQDFGPGLSHEDVFTVYTQYGASTKRDSDDAVGMLGIGSKSAFAYADTFTIISCHGGFRRIYVAVLDDTDKGVINLLNEEECGGETGVTIEIAVDPDDIWEFDQKAQQLFRHFEPRPDINIDLPDPPTVTHSNLKHGKIYDNRDFYGGEGWIAVMGCVPYHINLNKLKEGGVNSYLHRLDGELYFDIGEVHINASREELKYTEVTKKAILEKLDLLVEEYVRTALNDLNSLDISHWEKRLKGLALQKTGLPFPEGDMFGESVSIEDVDAKTFKFVTPDHWRNKEEKDKKATKVLVNPRSKLVLKNDDRSMKGYNFDYVERLVVPIVPPGKKPEWDKIRKELDQILEEYQLTGISIEKISDRIWRPPVRRSFISHAEADTKKHQVRTFRLKDDTKTFRYPWSNAWEIEKRNPTDDDVFVILYNFNAQDKDAGAHTNIYNAYREDQQFLKTFGLTMPPVYGYKTTKQKPVTESECKGTNYFEWRKGLAEKVLTKKVRFLAEKTAWATLGRRGPITPMWGTTRRTEKREEAIQEIKEVLGPDHIVVETIEKHFRARKFMKVIRKKHEALVGGVEELLPRMSFKLEAELVLQTLKESYPLLFHPEFGLTDLWDTGPSEVKYRNHWLDYIKMCDATKTEETSDDDSTEVHSDERDDHDCVDEQDPRGEEGVTELSRAS